MGLKHKCFLWHVLQGTLKTWDNLSKRGWYGPNRCSLCKNSAETIDHLFIYCTFGKKVWDFCCTKIASPFILEEVSIGEALLRWTRRSLDTVQIPIFISWALWFTRNSSIFQDMELDVSSCGFLALKLLHQYPVDTTSTVVRSIGQFSFIVNQPILFFDGAAQNGYCAAGGVIYLNQDHFFTLRLNCGLGSNMKAELLALWCVLRCANSFGLVNIRVFGDSRVTIKWASNEFDLNVIELSHWCQRTRMEIDSQDILFEHIYREYNSQADSLSKQALLSSEGLLVWEEWMDSSLLECGEFYFL